MIDIFWYRFSSKAGRVIPLLFFSLISIYSLVSCKPPESRVFNHSQTLFPLNGAHTGVNCRECHKDGGITSLPTTCSSCHPMPPAHGQNLGDCTLCHNTTTFSAAFFNHKIKGFNITGKHNRLVGTDCYICHKNKIFPGLSFTCSGCHQPGTFDSRVHTSTTMDCSICHSQISFVPAAFPEHNSYPTPLTGRHLGISCSSCHNAPFVTWLNINYRDGQTYGSCANCHTRNYQSNDHHSGIAADANCARCHSTGGFHD